MNPPSAVRNVGFAARFGQERSFATGLRPVLNSKLEVTASR